METADHQPRLPCPGRNADEYFMQSGEVPILGRSPLPPWRYYGWLCLQVQRIHKEAAQAGVFPDRWGYYYTTLENGALLPDPIPPVTFKDARGGAARKNLAKCLDIIACKEGGWGALTHLVEWLAYGLGVSDTDCRLDDGLCEKLYRTLDLCHWLREPSDHLGALAAERFGGGPHAFFPTPHHICEVMMRIQMERRNEDLRDKLVMEPALGTGRMLLAASNYSMRLCGVDIDQQVLLMAKCNFAVYAPWALYGLPFERVSQALQVATLASKVQVLAEAVAPPSSPAAPASPASASPLAAPAAPAAGRYVQRSLF